MKKVVWGVLSTARIGIEKVIPAMQRSAWCDLRAIASRSQPSARKAADALGIPVAYGSYEALLADPAIEAVYNPLPNHLHVALTLAAARAGKHVLCEKPIALSADEARRLQAVPAGVRVMEAFMVRFHPQWLRARELVRQGRVGTLRAVQVFFSFFNADPGNIRNQAAIGGGGLYDLGCYPIVGSRFLFECEPRRAVALVDRDPAFGTDRMTSALVERAQPGELRGVRPGAPGKGQGPARADTAPKSVRPAPPPRAAPRRPVGSAAVRRGRDPSAPSGPSPRRRSG